MVSIRDPHLGPDPSQTKTSMLKALTLPAQWTRHKICPACRRPRDAAKPIPCASVSLRDSHMGSRIGVKSRYLSAQKSFDYRSHKRSCGPAATTKLADGAARSANPHSAATIPALPAATKLGQTAVVRSRHPSAQKRRDGAQAFAWCNLNTYPDVKGDVLEPAHWETLSAVSHADTAILGNARHSMISVPRR